MHDHKNGSTARNLRKERLNHGCGTLKDRILNRSKADWDTKPPEKKYFDELMRVSKNQIIWGGNYFPLPPSRCIAVWDKMQPWENFSQVELAWTSFDKPASFFQMSNTGGIGEKKIHPTQKPIDLYLWLINKYAWENDLILDTHVGSGSSLIACRRTGHKYVGFEIDEEYYKNTKRRVNNAAAQMTIFDLPQGQQMTLEDLC